LWEVVHKDEPAKQSSSVTKLILFIGGVGERLKPPVLKNSDRFFR